MSTAYPDQWNTRAGKTFSAKMKARWKEQQLPCWLCGQPIDYDAAPQTSNACEPDHVVPRKEAPELMFDEDNVRPAHSSCNRARGDRTPPPQLGPPSRNWFL